MEWFGDSPPPDLDRQLVPFGSLFPLRAPGDAWRPTPRSAALLHATLGILADEVDDDVYRHGPDPVLAGREGRWSVLHRLPRETWTVVTAWRRSLANALDLLAADLEAGRLPFPRCLAEHHALHLGLTDAAEALATDPDLVAADNAHLPADPTDYDWHGCRRSLMTTRTTTGVPATAWFLPFPDVEPRGAGRQ
ncbi:hypothetical protein [Embleya sp. AB8]|uniref:hypothetical protein n=1 Tax=Embleya sp. AB8 TaxID=3156304 RepID=UPI003C7288CB